MYQWNAIWKWLAVIYSDAAPHKSAGYTSYQVKARQNPKLLYNIQAHSYIRRGSPWWHLAHSIEFASGHFLILEPTCLLFKVWPTAVKAPHACLRRATQQTMWQGIVLSGGWMDGCKMTAMESKGHPQARQNCTPAIGNVERCQFCSYHSSARATSGCSKSWRPVNENGNY